MTSDRVSAGSCLLMRRTCYPLERALSGCDSTASESVQRPLARRRRRELDLALRTFAVSWFVRHDCSGSSQMIVEVNVEFRDVWEWKSGCEMVECEVLQIRSQAASASRAFPLNAALRTSATTLPIYNIFLQAL